MFKSAASFNQNLCVWGSMMDTLDTVDQMFEQTNCDDSTGTPSLASDPKGPLCHRCYKEFPTKEELQKQIKDYLEDSNWAASEACGTTTCGEYYGYATLLT